VIRAEIGGRLLFLLAKQKKRRIATGKGYAKKTVFLQTTGAIYMFSYTFHFVISLFFSLMKRNKNQGLRKKKLKIVRRV